MPDAAGTSGRSRMLNLPLLLRLMCPSIIGTGVEEASTNHACTRFWLGEVAAAASAAAVLDCDGALKGAGCVRWCLCFHNAVSSLEGQNLSTRQSSRQSAVAEKEEAHVRHRRQHGSMDAVRQESW